MRVVLATGSALKNYHCRARIFEYTTKKWNWSQWSRLKEIRWGFEIEYAISSFGPWRSYPCGPGRPGFYYFGFRSKPEAIEAANKKLDSLCVPQEYV